MRVRELRCPELAPRCGSANIRQASACQLLLQLDTVAAESGGLRLSACHPVAAVWPETLRGFVDTARQLRQRSSESSRWSSANGSARWGLTFVNWLPGQVSKQQYYTQSINLRSGDVWAVPALIVPEYDEFVRVR